MKPGANTMPRQTACSLPLACCAPLSRAPKHPSIRQDLTILDLSVFSEPGTPLRSPGVLATAAAMRSRPRSEAKRGVHGGKAWGAGARKRRAPPEKKARREANHAGPPDADGRKPRLLACAACTAPPLLLLHRLTTHAAQQPSRTADARHESCGAAESPALISVSTSS